MFLISVERYRLIRASSLFYHGLTFFVGFEEEYAIIREVKTDRGE